MSLPDRISPYLDELVAIRRDLHAHPELGFEEERTSGIVAERLSAWGFEVHRGIGKTGVVGVLHGKSADGRRIGLRADMDALPIEETTNLSYRSTRPGKMHACGHDGHTTMLLGAARYLAEARTFDGTAVLIFQPAGTRGCPRHDCRQAVRALPVRRDLRAAQLAARATRFDLDPAGRCYGRC